MDKVTLRPARKEDMPAVRRLIHAVDINPTGLYWKRFILAVSEAGELIGTGQIKHHGDGSFELASIAVRPEQRGQGIARRIIEKLLSQEAHRPLYLMCRSRLGEFYEKFRFHAVTFEDMPRYFQQISRAERIFNRNAPAEDRLLIMRLDE